MDPQEVYRELVRASGQIRAAVQALNDGDYRDVELTIGSCIANLEQLQNVCKQWADQQTTEVRITLTISAPDFDLDPSLFTEEALKILIEEGQVTIDSVIPYK